MNKEPKVSVVITSYNPKKEILNQTLESVFNQTYKNIEIILIDDCSKIEPNKIIDRKYLNKINIFILEKNSGSPVKPRNYGAEVAKGEYVAFLDCDDYWHPEKIQYQVSVAIKNNVQFISTKMRDFKSNPQELIKGLKEKDDVQKITLNRVLLKYPTPTGSIFIKKTLLENIQFDRRYPPCEDLDFVLKVHQEIRYSLKINFPLLLYRVHPNQVSKNKLKMLKTKFNVLRNFKLNNGKRLGYVAILLIFTDIMLSVYYRLLKKEL